MQDLGIPFLSKEEPHFDLGASGRGKVCGGEMEKSRVFMRRCLQDKRWSCAGVGCADRFGIRKSPCHLRPTCLESLLGGDPASGPWSWSEAGMMSSMPAPRGWKGEGDASLWRKTEPAGHCPEAT